jgi:hypothetical protein
MAHRNPLTKCLHRLLGTGPSIVKDVPATPRGLVLLVVRKDPELRQSFGLLNQLVTCISLWAFLLFLLSHLNLFLVRRINYNSFVRKT